MDEEVDYMSDDFIKSCLSGVGDVRPGLLHNRKQKREHELDKKKKSEMRKPTSVCQAEALEEGLNQPIDSTNKGFSMLAKMGFKSGMGLGKNNSGRVEPIAITIKNNKRGLGLEAKNSRAKRKVENKLDKINVEDFTALLSRRDRNKKIVSDLRKSQRICKELDFKCSKEEPDVSWYWPVESKEQEGKTEDNWKGDDKHVAVDDSYHDDDDDGDNDADGEEGKEDNIPDEEKLEILTKYLRTKYFYCIWCTVQYADEKDMQECPGSTRDDH